MAVLESIGGGGYYLWRYLPSVPAAVIFVLLFLGLTGLILWRMFKTRTWFCIPFAIGGIFEVAGYCARASAHNQTGKIIPYAVQNVFILLGPALFAASIYMCLSRIIRGVGGDRFSLIRPKRLTLTFVTGDILSFVVQGNAASFMITAKNPKIGESMVIGGLMIQIIMFGLFAATAVIFQRRINRRPTVESNSSSIPWKQSMRMLFVISGLIMVRSMFRVIEYAMGNDGFLLRHEWPIYIFDAVLMITVMIVYYLWYPTWFVPEKRGTELDVI